MLSWEPFKILSYGAGTPSTTLALMACENARHGPPYPWQEVPIYDAVIFCDLHAEPSWVYRQADFVSRACADAGIPFYTLSADLYGDFTGNFGRRRVSSIPFWTIGPDGKAGRMPRQCTCDYKIKVIEQFVRHTLLGYCPRQHTKPWDVHTHEMHMGIMWEERRRAVESKQRLFVNCYPLVETGWTRAECFGYNKERWGLETWASSCVFCPFHTNYFYAYLREHEPASYARALLVDERLAHNEARPPLKSKLYLSKCKKRLPTLTAGDSRDAQTFFYHGAPVWNGF